MPQPKRQRQRQRPTARAQGSTARAQGPKTDWQIIEGDSNRVLAAIQKILESTGDDAFTVEFRIYESQRAKKAAPAPRSRHARH